MTFAAQHEEICVRDSAHDVVCGAYVATLLDLKSPNHPATLVKVIQGQHGETVAYVPAPSTVLACMHPSTCTHDSLQSRNVVVQQHVDGTPRRHHHAHRPPPWTPPRVLPSSKRARYRVRTRTRCACAPRWQWSTTDFILPPTCGSSNIDISLYPSAPASARDMPSRDAFPVLDFRLACPALCTPP
jgi:hypothetical protein